MINGKHCYVVRQLLRFAVCIGYGKLRKEMPQCVASQWHNDFRLDQCNLHLQPWHADFFLLGRRISVSRRTVLHDIGNVDIFALEPYGKKQFIQKLSRSSHKRPSEFIFFLSRCFAYEHDLRLGIAFTKRSEEHTSELQS